jgi:hypothetical protein
VKKKADKPAATPVFRKKENATLAQQIEILDWHHKNGQNQMKIAQHFNAVYPNLKIKQLLVLSWIKEEVKWRELWEQTNHQDNWAAKRAQQTEHPEVSEMMYLWVLKAMADGILVTREVLLVH